MQSVFVFLIHPTESLYRLCHQRQTADEIHARKQTVLPVQDVEICGVASVRVRHYDFNCPQHSRADDEGQWFLLLMWRSTDTSQIQYFSARIKQCSDTHSAPSVIQHTAAILTRIAAAVSINLNYLNNLVVKAEM